MKVYYGAFCYAEKGKEYKGIFRDVKKLARKSVAPSCRDILFVKERILNLYRKTISAEVLQDIAIAGGFSSQCYCLSMWWLPLEERKKNCYYCGDCDTFVTNKVASTEAEFLAFMLFWEVAVARAGYKITEKTSYYRTYSANGAKLCIRDYRVKGIDMKLSFIYHPEAKTIQDVIGSFDIDLVKVILDIKTGSFSLTPEVDSALRHRAGSVRPFVFSSYTVPKDEVRHFLCSVSRCGKYSTRYFTMGFPRVMCSGEVPPKRYPPRGIGVQQRNAFRRRFARTVSLLRAIVPEADVRSDSVGLVGDVVLGLFVCGTRKAGNITYCPKIATVFVCGQHAETDADFQNFMGIVLVNLLNYRSPDDPNDELETQLHQHCTRFMLNAQYCNLPAMIMEFNCNRIFDLVFVRCKGIATVKDAIMKFPVTALSLFWDFFRNRIYVPPLIRPQLENGLFSARDIIYRKMPPTELELFFTAQVFVFIRHLYIHGLRPDRLPNVQVSS